MKILENQTEDGEFAFSRSLSNETTIFVKGVFGNADLHFEFSPDEGTTWFRDESLAANDETVFSIKISPNDRVRSRMVLENAGPSTSITVHVV